MKTLRVSLLSLVGLTAAGALFASDPKPVSRAEVTFVKPEEFTDAADAERGSDWGRDGNLQELKEFIQERANRLVSEGQKLTVSITDVDLAGEIEPWRSSQMRDARIVKEIYPPRIDLSFKLTDASGAVVKEGTRHLTNLTFMMNLYPNRSDPRVYEKGLLDDWMRNEFGGKKK